MSDATIAHEHTAGVRRRLLNTARLGLLIAAFASSPLWLVGEVAATVGVAQAERSSWPVEGTAKSMLEMTHRHGEWRPMLNGPSSALAWVSYPDRARKAALVVIAASDRRLTDQLRAAADQLAAEGYIGVVPDLVLADVNLESARKFARTIDAANGKVILLGLDATGSGASVELTSVDQSSGQSSHFTVNNQTWATFVGRLNTLSGNTTTDVVTMPHMSHDAYFMTTAAVVEAPPAAQVPRGYPGSKLESLPAGLFTAKSTLLHSPIKGEWQDIATPGIGQGHLHTWVTYPAGDAPAGVVVVMQHGPGMDDWVRSVADQLSREGFIALAPDLHTGLGPNGGNYDSFEGPDAALVANRQLKDTVKSYAAVRDFGLKLPHANGKSASIGFCMGGLNSWRVAATVPELSAAVVYYGDAPSADEMANIKAPVLGFYAENDVRITAGVDPAQQLMKKLGKSFEAHIYPKATHGFLEFQDLGGNAPATSDSWQRTMTFLHERLR